MKRNLPRRIGNKSQQGIGLIELAISLAIVAAVLFGIFYLVNVVQGKRATTAEAQNLTMMASDLRTKFGNQASFAGINANNMIKLGLVPESMISGTAMISGFSTPVTVAPTNLNGQANDGFTFTYQVPSRNCSDFVSAVEGTFSRVAIAGTAIKDLTANDNDISVADLASCDASAGGGSSMVSVAFTQGR